MGFSGPSSTFLSFILISGADWEIKCEAKTVAPLEELGSRRVSVLGRGVVETRVRVRDRHIQREVEKEGFLRWGFRGRRRDRGGSGDGRRSQGTNGSVRGTVRRRGEEVNEVRVIG